MRGVGWPLVELSDQVAASLARRIWLLVLFEPLLSGAAVLLCHADKFIPLPLLVVNFLLFKLLRVLLHPLTFNLVCYTLFALLFLPLLQSGLDLGEAVELARTNKTGFKRCTTFHLLAVFAVCKGVMLDHGLDLSRFAGHLKILSLSDLFV